jgi:hypothetical protein
MLILFMQRIATPSPNKRIICVKYMYIYICTYTPSHPLSPHSATTPATNHPMFRPLGKLCASAPFGRCSPSRRLGTAPAVPIKAVHQTQEAMTEYQDSIPATPCKSTADSMHRTWLMAGGPGSLVEEYFCARTSFLEDGRCLPFRKASSSVVPGVAPGAAPGVAIGVAFALALASLQALPQALPLALPLALLG